MEHDATEHDTGESPTGPKSRLFDALADGRRRVVVDSLTEADAPMDVRELARRVAARERSGAGDAPGSPPPDAVHRVHVSLHHAHLPKLDDAGLVEYDADRQVVVDVAEPPDLPGLGE